MNKPYKCHVEGCPCTIELFPDLLVERVETGFEDFPLRVKITCYGNGSCNQTYTIDINTMSPVELQNEQRPL